MIRTQDFKAWNGTVRVLGLSRRGSKMDWCSELVDMRVVSTVFRNTVLYSCAAALLTAAPELAARTYKWVDENGVTHYSQSKPPNRKARELTIKTQPTPADSTADDCSSLVCRAERMGHESGKKKRAEQEKQYEQDKRNAALKAENRQSGFPPAGVETTSQKVDRLVAECKANRGARCDSPEEKRRMLLKNVELTDQERRSLQWLSPAEQRRQLERRIPEEYRTGESATEDYRQRELRKKYGTTN